MNLSQRTRFLKSLFSYEKKVIIEDSSLEIHPFRFTQRMGNEEMDSIQQEIPTSDFCRVSDNSIPENKQFTYTIFVPRGMFKSNKALLLLHGLNERNWDKYLTWAERLTITTGRPVILFPIAFHMNRTPVSWFNPRLTLPWVNRRKEKITNLVNSTFVNVALSSRLSESPLRFYVSGRESVFNLWQLFAEIRTGAHPLFLPDTRINIFAYSIGALLAQVFLLANPEGLFDESKLFMFCGGSIFNRMDGNARDIIDQEAFMRVQQYYLHEFLSGQQDERVRSGKHTEKHTEKYTEDSIARAFRAMIRSSEKKEYREKQFENVRKRIRAISLKHDTVMPTAGVREAFGQTLSADLLEERDFPFPYSHQHPFPGNDKIDPGLVYNSFCGIFDTVTAFLC